MLWSRLRDRRLGGLKFRRQHPIDGLVVDFCCVEALLIVELDSRYHDGRQAEDEARDRRTGELGYLTVRVTAGQVSTSLNGALEFILRTAQERNGMGG
ncbi:MAG: very-short-patch-repair endonuclease [Phycisphaerales bacterium]